jgi:(1->4)-alpha-D-glucan 1-alpha-D-glucosylmutase
VVASGRRADADAVVVVVPRLSARLTGFGGQLPLGQATWGDTWVSLDRPGLEGVYTDRFTGQRLTTALRDGVPVLPVSSLFGLFPVAMLKREENP